MEYRIIVFYVLLFSNAIHLAENSCDKYNINSSEGKTVCKNEYDDYGGYSHICGPEYQIIKQIITCSHMSITNIISNVYVDRDDTIIDDFPITLKVTDSDIAVLPTSIFKNVKKFTILFLENSNIQQIIPGAFNFLENLKELYLGGNKLTTISNGLFNSLTSLEKLDLSRNKIQDISDHAFQGVKLTELHLHHNNISQMEQALLDSLTSLRTLDISWNNLGNITNFNNLPLSTLNLSHNSIDVVDFEFFPGNIFTIDLSFNSINEIINLNVSEASEVLLNHNHIHYFDKNEHIQILDLSYNELETIGDDVLGVTLKKFNAGNNLIALVNTSAFSGLYELEYLLLGNNSLSSLPNSCFKDLHSLIYLDLSRNKLTSFTFGTFDSLVSLHVLNISYNNLKDLHQYTFHALGTLTDFFFQNNEISEINIDDLHVHMLNLRRINLDGNVWSCNKLVDIVHKLKTMKVSFPDGNYWQKSNIYGIKCYETSDSVAVDEGSKLATDEGYKKLNSFFNEDFTKTLMYKYFNEDFKDSNFFKYLESLINTTSNKQHFNITSFKILLNELKLNFSDAYNKQFEQGAIFKYFNKDFNNSTFFKYLENFKTKVAIENNSDKLIDRKFDEVIRCLEKILENTSNRSLNINESDIYKDFKEDLKTFFKHMEHLSDRPIQNNYENFNESKVEKLVRVPEVGGATPYNTNYIGLQPFILTFLIIITCVLTMQAYFTIFYKKRFGPSRKEDVELI